jgi:transposase-like protein
MDSEAEPVTTPSKTTRRAPTKIRRNFPIRERKKLVKAYLESGIPLREFIQVHDVALSSFGTWVKRYRNDQHQPSATQATTHKGTGTMTVTTAKVHNDDLRVALERIAELENQLKNAKIKIKALNNVVVLLGHQVGEDE